MAPSDVYGCASAKAGRSYAPRLQDNLSALVGLRPPLELAGGLSARLREGKTCNGDHPSVLLKQNSFPESPSQNLRFCQPPLTRGPGRGAKETPPSSPSVGNGLCAIPQSDQPTPKLAHGSVLPESVERVFGAYLIRGKGQKVVPISFLLTGEPWAMNSIPFSNPEIEAIRDGLDFVNYKYRIHSAGR